MHMHIGIFFAVFAAADAAAGPLASVGPRRLHGKHELVMTRDPAVLFQGKVQGQQQGQQEGSVEQKVFDVEKVEPKRRGRCRVLGRPRGRGH